MMGGAIDIALALLAGMGWGLAWERDKRAIEWKESSDNWEDVYEKLLGNEEQE